MLKIDIHAQQLPLHSLTSVAVTLGNSNRILRRIGCDSPDDLGRTTWQVNPAAEATEFLVRAA